MLKRFLYAGIFAVVCLGLVTVFLIKRFDRTVPLEVRQAIPRLLMAILLGVCISAPLEIRILNRDHLATDPDLAPLREDPRFPKLLKLGR